MKQIRRYVVGTDESGRSHTQYDNAAPAGMVIGKTGATGLLWTTQEMPADNAGAQDRAGGPFYPFPKSNGTIFSYLVLPPESEIDPQLNPGMHRTKTLDYGVVLEGQVWFTTEQDAFLMQAGDTIVCRGARHYWSNRSDQPCVIIFVVVDAQPL